MKKSSLKDSIQFVKGVGPKRFQLFRKMNLETIEDCLYFLPHRYEDRSRVVNISELTPDEVSTFQGEIIHSGATPLGRRRKIYEVLIEDPTGTVQAKWYKFNSKYMEQKYAVGQKVVVSGKPTHGRSAFAGLEIIHPVVDTLSGEDSDSLETGRVVPIYSITEGLHLKTLRKIMKQVVDNFAPATEEFFPEDLRRRNDLMDRSKAFAQAHFPDPDVSGADLAAFKTPAQRRLIFEELFLILLGLAFKKRLAGESSDGVPLKTRGETIRKFVRLLSFDLTGAQKRVLTSIMSDLENARPMNRLLHGDVGSGKTLIAMVALLTAVDNGFQGALMAPTELLAEQHYLNLHPFCQEIGVNLALATGTLRPKDRKNILESVEAGQVQIAVGTHALFQKDVRFKNLAVAVIDEQHRFGVRQRETFGKKGPSPHVLVMTATPIPRSLAMVLYGNMDVSVLDEMPPGRKEIVTKLFFQNRRDQAYQFLRGELEAGRQAYVVAPLIEESALVELKNVQEIHQQLQRDLFPERRVEIIHGKLKKEDRQELMANFKAGKIHILVATTVIEVGVDVPNATIMIVEHAERFGLAQLHQLRGRVGRGGHASHCLLVAYPPVTEEGKARLETMVKSSDGFVIAEKDLEIRGPGDVMGARQSGLPSLRVANLVRDVREIETARNEVQTLIEQDPKLEKPEHQKLKQALFDVWGDGMDLTNIL